MISFVFYFFWHLFYPLRSIICSYELFHWYLVVTCCICSPLCGFLEPRSHSGFLFKIKNIYSLNLWAILLPQGYFFGNYVILLNKPQAKYLVVSPLIGNMTIRLYVPHITENSQHVLIKYTGLYYHLHILILKTK